MPYDPSQYPEWGESQRLFSIFIPTYNRARLLNRALEICARQTFRDFEVVVIDDGSTDDTASVLREWGERADFRLRWQRQENSGKPRAYNAALGQVQGYFLVLLDSDDRLVEDALDIFKRHWEGIPDDHRLAFAGVEGLMRDLRTGTLESDPFPRPVIDSNFLEVEYGYRLRRERRHAIRLVVAREYPLPVIAGEKEMRESVIFARMAHRYRFRYFNEVVQEKELLPDSLSAHGVRRRRSNPMSFRLAFMELLNRHRGYLTPAQRYACAVRYVRYSVSGGVDLRG